MDPVIHFLWGALSQSGSELEEKKKSKVTNSALCLDVQSSDFDLTTEEGVSHLPSFPPPLLPSFLPSFTRAAALSSLPSVFIDPLLILLPQTGQRGQI